MVLELIENNLEEHIKNEIYSFIPVENLFWVEKKYYVKNHSYLQSYIQSLSKSMYDNYIRFVIRHDFDFIFETILNTHNIHFWKSQKYNFKGVKYQNYFHFLDCFMFENNAHKCREILFTNVFRKKYKKICRSIAWSN